MTLRVAIVGAGIGGLTAALALASNGCDVTLLERRTGFGETGAGIQLSPNASRILIGLGLGPGLSRIGSEPSRIVIRSIRSGGQIASVTLGRAMRERYGAPYLVVARADLHTALLDAVRSRGNIRLLVGRSLVSARDARDQAQIVVETGAGGRETIEADLVVGADGLWSPTRAALGDGRDPVFSGFSASRAVVPADALGDAVEPGATGLWLGAGRHVVHYPVGGGRFVNIVCVERGTKGERDWSQPDTRPALLGRFPAAAPALRRILKAPESWSVWSLFDLPARRSTGIRTVLIGDAAHPVLPYLAQGGALAIEDAAELAAQVRACEGDVGPALAAYARGRLPRVQRVQREARRNGRLYHLRAPAAFARDVVLRRSDPDAMADRYAWLYDWRPTSAGAPA